MKEPLKMPAMSASAPQAKKTVKKFAVKPWEPVEGHRIIIYGNTGIGKTSLAALSPKPVFFGLDKGGSKHRHPVTGKPLNYIEGLETFEDLRSCLQQLTLFDDYKTVVIDTATLMQDWAEDFIVRTIKHEKGHKVENIARYGYNKGYKHLYNTMRIPLQDFDGLIRHNKNVVLICQSTSFIVGSEDLPDYVRVGPRLYSDKKGNYSVEASYCEWADHVLRINYFEQAVADKKIVGSTKRAIYAREQSQSYRAKSRTIKKPVISFENEADSSLWTFMLGGK